MSVKWASVLCLVALCACSGAATNAITARMARDNLQRTPGAVSQSPIKHVVIIIQENRSVDNLFNGLPGADTVTSGIPSKNQAVALRSEPLANPYDLGHRHADFLTDFNGGKMNGFDLSPVFPIGPPPPPDAAYAFVRQSDVAPYFTMAERYAFADRMFQSNSGGSFPAHLYIATATAAIDSTGMLFALENPTTLKGELTAGCDSPTRTKGLLINPQTNDQTQYAFPCFDHHTMWDSLDTAHRSWRWYQWNYGDGLFHTPDAFRHIRYGSDYANVISPNSTILSDIANGQLAAVSWVVPNAAESDHPSINNGSGPAWVASIVNAIGGSTYWNSTAIFVLWDDWGGWYDHVAPLQYNYEELGFRVPFIAISPYARAHYVSHVQHEFGSIDHFLETTFALSSLGYTDARADNLSDMFNYTQPPRTFVPIPAPTLAPAVLRDTGAPDND